tara:strand:- start:244 stop:399 length:156 start_codon:yes stop_codon:yes gene_type:complete
MQGIYTNTTKGRDVFTPEARDFDVGVTVSTALLLLQLSTKPIFHRIFAPVH